MSLRFAVINTKEGKELIIKNIDTKASARGKKARQRRRTEHRCQRCNTQLEPNYTYANCEACKAYINQARHKKAGNDEK